MNISHLNTTNIDNYEGYIKKKKSVTNPQLSSKNDYKNIQTPLERNSKNLSFKGVSSAFSLYSRTRPYNYNKSIETVSKYLGGVAERLGNNVNNYKEMNDFIIKEGNSFVLKEKQPLLLLCEALKFPFVDLPLIILNNSIAFMKKHKIVSKDFKGPLAEARKTLNNDELLNSLNGYLKTVDKYTFDTNKDKSAGLFNNAMKMFDPKTGNYNGVHERALTRIVTGFTSAIFLSNDAFNLSRLIDDNKDSANKEKKTRFNQESKRVVLNSYIQLITLGALSKFINKSKAAFVGITIATVIFTEAFSRLTNGKKLHLISKDEAKKINANDKTHNKNSCAPEHEKKKTAEIPTPTISEANVAPNTNITNSQGLNSSKAFKKFDTVTKISFGDSPINPQKKSSGTKTAKDEKNKELKPLISLKGILKWVTGTIVIGFALKHAQGLKIGKNLKIENCLKIISNKYDSLYKKITTQSHSIAKDEFNRIVDKLKKYEPAFAQKFEEITHEHQMARTISKSSKDLAKDLKDAGLDKMSEYFQALADSKLSDSFKDFVAYDNAQLYLKNLNQSQIQTRLDDFYQLLKDNRQSGVADEIKKFMTDSENKFNTEGFDSALSSLKKRSKELLSNESTKNAGADFERFAATFENKFMINENEYTVSAFNKALSALKKTESKAVDKYENLLESAINSPTYDLGSKNKKIVREIGDFVTEPFRFIWSLVKLPYTIANKLVKSLKPQAEPPSWPKEIQSISNGVKKLSKKMKMTDEEFRKYMDKNINQAFNNVTMSGISNSDLSALAKYTTTAATSWFLIADNYNMVMLKTDGENKKDANLKAKERAVQETSRMFYNQLFINLFNNTFRNVYNSSLLGAEAVNIASTTIGEYVNRTAIGMPVKEMSRDEILQKEYENVSSPGAKGNFFRFMSRLTGKQVLSKRETKKEAELPKK